jgi:hypothetical protein
VVRLVVADAAERATTGRLGERLTGGIEALERDRVGMAPAAAALLAVRERFGDRVIGYGHIVSDDGAATLATTFFMQLDDRAAVDAFIAADPEARVACETLVTTNRIILAGEVRASRPGADKAESWIADAERYRKAMEALEVIETAAVLDQRGLRDGAGNPVRQLSPLIRP